MPRKRPTEASWDSDDDLLDDDLSGINAFPVNKADEIDEDELLGTTGEEEALEVDLGDQEPALLDVLDIEETIDEEFVSDADLTGNTSQLTVDYSTHDESHLTAESSHAELDESQIDTSEVQLETSQVDAEDDENMESEEDEDDDDEDSRGGRFKSERTNIVSTKSKRVTEAIPDTLEISAEDQAKIDEYMTHESQQRRGRGRRGRGGGRGQMRGGFRPQFQHPPQGGMHTRPLMPHLRMQRPMGAPRMAVQEQRPKIHVNPHFRGAGPAQPQQGPVLTWDPVMRQPRPGVPIVSGPPVMMGSQTPSLVISQPMLPNAPQPLMQMPPPSQGWIPTQGTPIQAGPVLLRAPGQPEAFVPVRGLMEQNVPVNQITPGGNIMQQQQHRPPFSQNDGPQQNQFHQGPRGQQPMRHQGPRPGMHQDNQQFFSGPGQQQQQHHMGGSHQMPRPNSPHRGNHQPHHQMMNNRPDAPYLGVRNMRPQHQQRHPMNSGPHQGHQRPRDPSPKMQGQPIQTVIQGQAQPPRPAAPQQQRNQRQTRPQQFHPRPQGGSPRQQHQPRPGNRLQFQQRPQGGPRQQFNQRPQGGTPQQFGQQNRMAGTPQQFGQNRMVAPQRFKQPQLGGQQQNQFNRPRQPQQAQVRNQQPGGPVVVRRSVKERLGIKRQSLEGPTEATAPKQVKIVAGASMSTVVTENTAQENPLQKLAQQQMSAEEIADRELQLRLEEQKRKREEIKRLKEMRRQAQATQKRAQLETRLSEQGLTLSDVAGSSEVQTETEVAPVLQQQQPAPMVQMPPPQQPAPQAPVVRQPFNQFRGQTHQQNMAKKIVNRARLNQANVQGQRIGQVIGQGQRQFIGQGPRMRGQGQMGMRPNRPMNMGQRLPVPQQQQVPPGGGDMYLQNVETVPINVQAGNQIQVVGQRQVVNRTVPQNTVKVLTGGPQTDRLALKPAVTGNVISLKGTGQGQRKVISNQGQRTVISGPTGGQKPAKRLVLTKSPVQKPAPKPAPAREVQPPPQLMSDTVVINDLATSTTPAQIQQLCNKVGPIKSITLHKNQNRAVVCFHQMGHAVEFQKKFSRHMLNLSHISVSLLLP